MLLRVSLQHSYIYLVNIFDVFSIYLQRGKLERFRRN